MSTHRRHYLQLQTPSAQPTQQDEPTSGAAFIVRVTVACMGAIALLSGLLLIMQPKATTAPVRAGAAQPVALGVIEQQTTSEARVDGWRAGFAAGVEQGCTQAILLSSPIAAR
jgi:hypothetical protein